MEIREKSHENAFSRGWEVELPPPRISCEVVLQRLELLLARNAASRAWHEALRRCPEKPLAVRFLRQSRTHRAALAFKVRTRAEHAGDRRGGLWDRF